LNDPLEFIDDISVQGMFHALLIRSPVARGILREIVCPPLPDSYYLIKAEHIPGENRLSDFSIPVLADKNLSYIGQPIAILTGPDESVLENLASEIHISADEIIPVFSHNTDNQEIIIKREISGGNENTISGENRKLITGTYVTGIQEHWYPETNGAVAVPSSQILKKNNENKQKKIKTEKIPPAAVEYRKAKKAIGSLSVFTATQWPYHVNRSTALVLGWHNEKVTVYPTRMAEHLDGKLWYPSLIACFASLAA